MKKMTCQQLEGACDLVFEAQTFDEIAAKSMAHGKAMIGQSDPAHLEAMQKMQARMKSPEGMKNWMEAKRAEFDALESE